MHQGIRVITLKLRQGFSWLCSLDDTVALSVYHYCNDHQQLETCTEEEVQNIIQFAEAVQLGKHVPDFLPASDYSRKHLEAWLRRCTHCVWPPSLSKHQFLAFTDALLLQLLDSPNYERTGQSTMYFQNTPAFLESFEWSIHSGSI